MLFDPTGHYKNKLSNVTFLQPLYCALLCIKLHFHFQAHFDFLALHYYSGKD